MWEPSAPSPLETMPSLAYPQIQNNLHINLASQVGISMSQKFFMCRSAIKDGKAIFLVIQFMLLPKTFAVPVSSLLKFVRKGYIYKC